jgi:hypothetical protein
MSFYHLILCGFEKFKKNKKYFFHINNVTPFDFIAPLPKKRSKSRNQPPQPPLQNQPPFENGRKNNSNNLNKHLIGVKYRDKSFPQV